MTSRVPIVDLSAWEYGDENARRQVSTAVTTALAEIGYVQVLGHGIPRKTDATKLDSADAARVVDTVKDIIGTNRSAAASASESTDTVQWADQTAGLHILVGDEWHDLSPADDALLVSLRELGSSEPRRAG